MIISLKVLISLIQGQLNNKKYFYFKILTARFKVKTFSLLYETWYKNLISLHMIIKLYEHCRWNVALKVHLKWIAHWVRGRVAKNPGFFKKKKQPTGFFLVFFWVLLGFIGFFLVFLGFLNFRYFLFIFIAYNHD